MLDAIEDDLYRGATPIVSALLAARVSTVLNLQASAKEMLWENVQLRAVKIHEYPIPCCPFFPPSLKHSLRSLAVMRTNCLRPTYVHCRQGVDRTGFVVALYRIVQQQWSVESAIAEMRKKGFHYWAFWWWMPELRRQAVILKSLTNRL